MFELAWWFYYVGAEPTMSLPSRNARVRQLVPKWATRHFGRKRGRARTNAVNFYRSTPSVQQ